MIRVTKFVPAFPKANIPSWVYTMSATPLSSTFCLKDLSEVDKPGFQSSSDQYLPSSGVYTLQPRGLIPPIACSVHKIFLGHGQGHLFMYGSFCATESSSRNRDCLCGRDSKISLDRKTFLSPALAQ